jgi:hypothetical protein
MRPLDHAVRFVVGIGVVVVDGLSSSVLSITLRAIDYIVVIVRHAAYGGFTPHRRRKRRRKGGERPRARIRDDYLEQLLGRLR